MRQQDEELTLRVRPSNADLLAGLGQALPGGEEQEVRITLLGSNIAFLQVKG